MDSIPFQITQNKFLIINEKLFDSYPKAKQLAFSPEPKKSKAPLLGLKILTGSLSWTSSELLTGLQLKVNCNLVVF